MNGEDFPDELVMLRGLVATLRAVAEHGDLSDVRKLLAEYARDEQDARTEAGKKSSRTAADATPAPVDQDRLYRDAYATGREHAGAAGWLLDHFEAVISTSDGSYGAAEEYRCRTCGAIGAQGTGPRTLLDLVAMASRHECLPHLDNPTTTGEDGPS